MFTWFLSVLTVFSGCESALANIVIHSETALATELTGFGSLAEETPIYKGNLEADGKQEITTPYRGLAIFGLCRWSALSCHYRR
jgi:hypothetical protein